MTRQHKLPWLMYGLEDFIANPKLYVDAWELLSAVADEPCKQYPELLLKDLKTDAGCGACTSCRARVIQDPQIRESRFKQLRAGIDWGHAQGSSVSIGIMHSADGKHWGEVKQIFVTFPEPGQEIQVMPRKSAYATWRERKEVKKPHDDD